MTDIHDKTGTASREAFEQILLEVRGHYLSIAAINDRVGDKNVNVQKNWGHAATMLVVRGVNISALVDTRNKQIAAFGIDVSPLPPGEQTTEPYLKIRVNHAELIRHLLA